MDIKAQMRIEDFLILNGWKSERGAEAEYFSFYKEGNMSVDVSRDEIVFLADEGDVYHIPVFGIHAYYAMIGYMVCNRQIGMGFKEPDERK